ncbi:membrane-bound serine protease (ClpP class) [Belliella baltica DSM 15883]|uniref:Membrane-bound serine protease (ClpP class) n=1 Tax=Belliella baltica (strain DSM 15883 / CIP 108006 / LMG 21964 / BA134) TaxID=866536 RepID=I3Z0Q4_BELBD|nr:NfeD family protein [Belliella baltica]AFL82822.1 membrane-bound serine protease (ClpP class) [Belliella baltica DSM 15883]
MTWFILLSLLSIGLILILTEIIFVPGTTIIGILGLIFTGAGIYYSFLKFDPSIAWVILGFALLANFMAIFYGFKSGVWNKFALKEAMTSRSFDGRLLGLELGMKGKAVSDIKPIGKAEFLEKIYEVKSESGFISVGTIVFITKLEDNRIIVKY